VPTDLTARTDAGFLHIAASHRELESDPSFEHREAINYAQIWTRRIIGVLA
jgi:hypothetical protein